MMRLSATLAAAYLGLVQLYGAGAVRWVEASSMNLEGVTEFTRSPKVWAVYRDPIKDPDGVGKEKKASTTLIDKVIKGTPAASVRFEWKKTISLYDRKGLLAAQKQGLTLDRWIAADNPLKGLVMSFHCGGKENGQPYAASFANMMLMYPEIEVVRDVADQVDLTSAKKGDQVILRGKCFGKKSPRVWMEYLDGGRVKSVRLKVGKPYLYADVKGNPNAVCMDQVSAGLDSAVQVQLPAKLPEAWDYGVDHNIVLSNGHCVNYLPFQIDADVE
jgi:hypothetical protein